MGQFNLLAGLGSEWGGLLNCPPEFLGRVAVALCLLLCSGPFLFTATELLSKCPPPPAPPPPPSHTWRDLVGGLVSSQQVPSKAAKCWAGRVFFKSSAAQMNNGKQMKSLVGGGALPMPCMPQPLQLQDEGVAAFGNGAEQRVSHCCPQLVARSDRTGRSIQKPALTWYSLLITGKINSIAC